VPDRTTRLEEVIPDYGGAAGAHFPVGGTVSTLQHVTFEEATFFVENTTRIPQRYRRYLHNSSCIYQSAKLGNI
jgi:hypothetical protein